MERYYVCGWEQTEIHYTSTHRLNSKANIADANNICRKRYGHDLPDNTWFQRDEVAEYNVKHEHAIQAVPRPTAAALTEEERARVVSYLSTSDGYKAALIFNDVRELGFIRAAHPGMSWNDLRAIINDVYASRKHM